MAQGIYTGLGWPLPGEAAAERPIPGSGAASAGESGSSPLNTLFIVGFALLIALLAMRLAGRGRRGR